MPDLPRGDGRQTGLELPADTAATYVMAKAFAGQGRFGSAPRTGGFVFFRFSPGDSWRWHGISHVGVVENSLTDGRVLTIEGNTDVAGGRTGGRVMRKKRSLQSVAGFGYPHYADSGSGVDQASGGVDANRRCTPSTVSALQQALGVAVDGDFGPLSTKALQRELGVEADGDIGPITVRALQVQLQVTVDGDWGPETTKALERGLDTRTFP